MNHHNRHKPGRRAARLAALRDACAALMRAADEVSVWRILAHSARDLSGVAFAAVIVRSVPEGHEEEGPLAPPAGAHLHLAVAEGLSQEQETSLRHVLLSRDELLAPLWQGAETLRVPGPLALAPLPAESPSPAGQEASAQAAQEQPLGPALLGVPLPASDGQVQGGLLVGLPKQAPLSLQDEAMLVSLAIQAALAMEKVRCVQVAQAQAQDLQAVMDQLDEGIVQVDAHGHMVCENAVARRLRERLQETSEGTQALAAFLQAPARLALAGRVGEPTLVRVPGEDMQRHTYAVTAHPLSALDQPAGSFAQDPQPSSTAAGRGADVRGALLVWHAVADERAKEMSEQPGAQVEGELAAWARQATAIFEAMPDAVLLYDPSGTLLQVNTAARRLLGLDAMPDYVSRPLEDRLALYVVQDMQGRVLPREQWSVSRVLRGEMLADGQAMEVLRMADGRQIQASFTGGPVHDQHGGLLGAVLTMRDRSERYRLERERQAAEQLARDQASQLAAIFEAMPEALFVYDQQGRATRMNAAGQQLYARLHLSDAAAAPMAQWPSQVAVWDAQGQPLARESLPNAHILAGKVLTAVQAVELAIRDPQGEMVSLSVTGGPLRDAQGQLAGAVTIMRDITTRKRTEQALRQQAEQLQLQAELIELAHDAILVRDADSRVISWNRGAEQLYGWSAQEALGWLSHELLQTSFRGSRAAADAYLEREGQWEGELWHTHRDGRKILVESRQVLMRDADGRPSAILEINRDITLRHQLEAFARRMHATTEARRSLLQLVLDELPTSVYLVRGRDARLVLANRATAALWGTSWALHQPRSEFLQQNGIRIYGGDGRELAPEQGATWRALLQGEAVSQQQESIRQPNGTSLPVLVNTVPLELSLLFPSPDEVTLAGTQAAEPAALVVHQDVSALKEAERIKDEFIAIAAHELRTPLAILKGYVHTLLLGLQHERGPQLAEWQQEAMDNIDQATQQLVELTEALLDVTRLQAGRLALQPEATDLVALARQVVKRLQRTTQQHRLNLHSSQQHLVVTLDPGRMEQVLTNLVGNAIKYSPQGGPIEVTVWTEPQTAEVVLSLRDEGIGIPEQQQAGIFGRFYRAANARLLPGTGLGLHICRSLVELHGGRLWFESGEERGTTFFLALPQTGEAAAPA